MVQISVHKLKLFLVCDSLSVSMWSQCQGYILCPMCSHVGVVWVDDFECKIVPNFGFACKMVPDFGVFISGSHYSALT